jgi:hypothetical protein
MASRLLFADSTINTDAQKTLYDYGLDFLLKAEEFAFYWTAWRSCNARVMSCYTSFNLSLA